ncbi:MAG: hypothetical protein JST44_09415 [Cyanobacteria bacterium SZAS LIN-5]|nr:hypothetical protein [Cyanobacteria bacterium SZAS LIN-5]
MVVSRSATDLVVVVVGELVAADPLLERVHPARVTEVAEDEAGVAFGAVGSGRTAQTGERTFAVSEDDAAALSHLRGQCDVAVRITGEADEFVAVSDCGADGGGITELAGGDDDDATAPNGLEELSGAGEVGRVGPQVNYQQFAHGQSPG